MVKIYYEDILIGSVITNNSLSIEDALEIIGFNEDQFISDHGFDAIDYNDFRMEWAS